jgi:hypothetical protein
MLLCLLWLSYCQILVVDVTLLLLQYMWELFLIYLYIFNKETLFSTWIIFVMPCTLPYSCPVSNICLHCQIFLSCFWYQLHDLKSISEFSASLLYVIMIACVIIKFGEYSLMVVLLIIVDSETLH